MANRSSPINWTDAPNRFVNAAHPVPVVLGQPVLDGDDGIALDPAGQEIDHALAVECLIAVGAKPINPASRVKKMRRGHIDGDRHVAPGLETAGEHGVHDDFERLLVAAEPRPVTPLVSDQARLEAPLLQDRADGAIHRDDHFQGFAVTLGADRDDEHVLDVEVAAGVQTARNHVDHRQRQGRLAVERTPFRAGSS